MKALYAAIRLLLLATLINVACASILHSQNYKEKTIVLDTDQKYRLQNVLDTIESQSQITLSYASNLFSLDDSLYVAKDIYTLEEIIDLIEQKYAVESTFKRRKKILLYRELTTVTPPIKFYGYLKDIETQSSIPSGYIYYDGGETHSDVSGYFEIDLTKIRGDQIYIDVIGYQPDSISINDGSPLIVGLQHVNILDTFFVIAPEADYIDQFLPPDGKLLDATGIASYNSITGEPDLITSIRHYSSFDVGGEGRHGLSIRGGSSDQNLVLLDDIPVFEFSHIGGYRSIFLPNTVQSAAFNTSGISAKYEGKLSSVLDVKLKSPNLRQVEGFANIGLDAASVSVSAPIIKDRWGIMIGGRTRLFRFIDQSLIQNILGYETVTLKYNDILVKSNFIINRDHQLSALFYSGSDIFSYEDRETEPQPQNIFNQIGWGNRIAGLSYRGIMSDKLSLKVNANRSEYFFNSRGALESFTSTNTAAYDVYSTSVNTVNTLKTEASYYHSYGGKTIAGARFADYTFSPNLFQSSTFLDPLINDGLIAKETFVQSEISAYIQSDVPVNENVTLVGGLKYLGLYNNDVLANPADDKLFFQTLEPRIVLHFRNDNIKSKIDFTIIHQPIHVLVNPGLGLPSDLWIPSSRTVTPQRSLQFGSAIDFSLDANQTIGFSVFNKSFSNVIDYADPFDLLFNVFNVSANIPFDASRLDTENSIIQGSGSARGVEVSYHVQSNDIIGWLNYGLTFSDRQFDQVNNGDPFPSRFDRRHSISAGLSYKVRAESNISIQWVYGSGYPFTLDIGQFKNPITCTFETTTASRNNFRTRDFHHLDLRYTWRKRFEKVDLQLSGGIYNVYNRQNPFYVYVRDIPNTPQDELVNVSLFPILPSVKANVAF